MRGQHDDVTDGKVTQCAVGLWCDSFEKEQIPVYTRVQTSCSEDPADTLSNLLALCCDADGVHAQANDRKSVCGTSSGGKLAKRKGLKIEKRTQRLAICGNSIPRIPGEPTFRCRTQAGNDGSVHLQLSGRRCEDVSTRR